MSNTTDTRPLIDIARQTALSVDYDLLQKSPEHARCFVAGYDYGIAVDPRALTIANARIAELEAQLAARPQVTPTEAIYGLMGWLTTQKGTLTLGETHNAAQPAELLEQYRVSQGWPPVRDDMYPDNLKAGPPVVLVPEPRPQAVGVVVDDGLIDAINEAMTLTEHKEGSWRTQLRLALKIALPSAHMIPLKDADPVRWRDDHSRDLFATREVAAHANNTTVSPLYEGLSEPARKEE